MRARRSMSCDTDAKGGEPTVRLRHRTCSNQRKPPFAPRSDSDAMRRLRAALAASEAGSNVLAMILFEKFGKVTTTRWCRYWRRAAPKPHGSGPMCAMIAPSAVAAHLPRRSTSLATAEWPIPTGISPDGRAFCKPMPMAATTISTAPTAILDRSRVRCAGAMPDASSSSLPVDWFNNRRLLEPIGNIPPAEAETNFYAALETEDMAA
jgi:hypothetical protein